VPPKPKVAPVETSARAVVRTSRSAKMSMLPPSPSGAAPRKLRGALMATSIPAWASKSPPVPASPSSAPPLPRASPCTMAPTVTLPPAFRLTKPPSPKSPLARTFSVWVVVTLPVSASRLMPHEMQSPLEASIGALTVTFVKALTLISPPEAPFSPRLPPMAWRPMPEIETAPVMESMSMNPPKPSALPVLALMVPLTVMLPAATSSTLPASKAPLTSMRARLVPWLWMSMKPLALMVTLPPSPNVPVTPFAMMRAPGSSVTLPALVMVSGAVPVSTSTSLFWMTRLRPPRLNVEPAGRVHAVLMTHGFAAGAHSWVALHCAAAGRAPSATVISASSAPATTTDRLRASMSTPTGGVRGPSDPWRHAGLPA
jgi:hypothetical protein